MYLHAMAQISEGCYLFLQVLWQARVFWKDLKVNNEVKVFPGSSSQA